MSRTQVCPIVFADVVGSSKIVDDRLKTTLHAEVTRILDDFKGRQVLAAKHTGDGFFVCGCDPVEMAEASLRARDRFRTTDWRRLGFPEPVRIRIGLDLGRVSLIEEGGRVVDVAGSGVDRGSRIEPVAGHNEVWCSDHLMDQLKADRVSNMVGIPLGKRSLAKGAGDEELHELRWSHEAADTPVAAPARPGPKASPEMPKIRRNIGDAERDAFAEAALPVLAEFFRNALSLLEKDGAPHVRCRFVQVSPLKFTAEVYVDGASRQRAKVWLGGRGREVCYAQGHWSLDQDNSFNESLHVGDDGRDVFFKPLGMAMVHGQADRLDAEGAAGYLWRVFTRHLGQ